jgi:hypothetical protein
LIALFLTAFAFTAKAGGDSYKIYLNNKLILEQFVTQPLSLNRLQLDKANLNDQLVIYYSHCGTTGKGRSISIKNDKGLTIKEWKFSDAVGSNAGMTIPVKDLLQLKNKNAHTELSIYYASHELPRGRMLTSLNHREKSIVKQSS